MAANIEYPTLSKKITRVILQIMLLPVYCALELFSILFIPACVVIIILVIKKIISFEVAYLVIIIPIWAIIRHFMCNFLFFIKGLRFSTNVFESTYDEVSTKTHYHDINVNGQQGWYATEEKEYTTKTITESKASIQRIQCKIFFLFAVFIGIIKLLLSIISCFSNTFYITTKSPDFSIDENNFKFFYFGMIENRNYHFKSRA